MAEQKTMADPLADVSQLLGGEYLRAADVELGPLTFGITCVQYETFEAKGEKKKAEKKVVLTLDGDPVRKLALNQTNLQTLMDAWGKDARLWVGKVFDAYFDKTVRDPSGKPTGGLRVRVRAVAQLAGVRAGANGSGTNPADPAQDDIVF